MCCRSHWNKDTDTSHTPHQRPPLTKKFYPVSVSTCIPTSCVIPLPVVTAHHTISVYPRQEVPFFMVFSGILCFSFMTLTVVAYHFPTVMTQYAKTVSTTLLLPTTGSHDHVVQVTTIFLSLLDKLQAILPSQIVDMLQQ